MKAPIITRDQCEAMDHDDPLAPHRSRFHLPDGLIYFDGNSLGPLSDGVHDALSRCVTQDWGAGLIRSWNDADWISLPQRLGDRLGRLIGAAPEQTVVADSTSVNLFKTLAAALDTNPDRSTIVSEQMNFPTDLYISEGIQQLKPHITRRLLGRDGDDLLSLIDSDVAVVYLTHVNYKTALIHDMQAVTDRAHEVGAVVVWDLAHSVGALPLSLDTCNVDFAVGCTYKYLNGGPGSPAFVYVNKRWHGKVTQPLTGWFAHKAPFAFSEQYDRATNADQFLCGTPPVLSFAALEAALDHFDDVDMLALRKKSTQLTRLFIDLVEQECGQHGFSIISPKDDALRASHVSMTHEQGYAIVQALIHQNVIGDFRAPDILRYGFAPLYNRYTEVFDAVTRLREILTTSTWQEPQFQQRNTVT